MTIIMDDMKVKVTQWKVVNIIGKYGLGERNDHGDDIILSRS